MSAAEFEQKRIEFRKYLEKEGFVDALQKALLKLYDEGEKPEDAILFIRQWLCEYCPNEEQFEKMKNDLFNAYVRVAELEVEVEKEKDLVIRSPEELQQELDDGFKSLQEDFQFTTSLLRKYLTSEIIQEYHQTKTPAPFLARLYECCKAGFKHHQAEIGVFACNKDCYDTFTLLFDPIIRDYHDFLGLKKPQLHGKVDFGDPSQILNLDPKKKYVMCTYIKISRNLNGFSFLPKMKFDDFLAVENKIKPAIEKLEGEFAGAYQNIIDIDIDDQIEMVKRHASFARGECPLKTEAGFDLYFPFGRGVQVNAKETFGVWVNHEDHLTVFAKEENGSLGIVYKRAVDGLKELETKGGLKFANNRKYGFVTADPANLGTAMKATMTMRLPFLSQHVEYLQNMANELQVKINVITLDEDDEENADIVLEVMTTKTMGRSEFEIMQTFEGAVVMLINTEVSLERGAVLKVPIPVAANQQNQK